MVVVYGNCVLEVNWCLFMRGCMFLISSCNLVSVCFNFFNSRMQDIAAALADLFSTQCILYGSMISRTVVNSVCSNLFFIHTHTQM